MHQKVKQVQEVRHDVAASDLTCSDRNVRRLGDCAQMHSSYSGLLVLTRLWPYIRRRMLRDRT